MAEDPAQGKEANPSQNKAPGAPDAAENGAGRRRSWRTLGILMAIGLIVLVIGVAIATSGPSPNVWTDDAYVTAHYATVAPRVAGQITSVNVTDNQSVAAGTLLARLDDRDYQVALETANATLARDQAELADSKATLSRQPSVVDQSSAGNPSAEARLTLALSNQRRYRALARSGAGSTQEGEEADEQVKQATSTVEQTRAMTEASRRQEPILIAQVAAAEAAIRADESRVAQARLNLGYTQIYAPVGGMIGRRDVQVGNYVSAGSPLMVVVPLDDIFIEANYRELALRHVLPGQHVRIHVDAYNMDLDGVVDSVPPASGAAFSPLEPNNATGNFTKIVQRLPVKILVRPGQNRARLLRLGFSVETTIETGLPDVVGLQDATARQVTAR